MESRTKKTRKLDVINNSLTEHQHWLILPGGGRRLARSWWPAVPARAVMAIVPGLGDHSGRYADLAAQLSQRGIAVVSMDFQGHGLSPGWRGCIDSYDALLSEVGSLTCFARGGQELQSRAAVTLSDQPIRLDHWPEDRNLPVCLYGHSMGGNLVLNALMRSFAQPERAISSAPMLRAVHPPGPLFMKIARMLKLVAPHWRLKAPVRKELLSHLNSEQVAYEVDRLMHRRVSLRLGAGLIDSGLWILENADQLKTPCLLLHGTQDRITDPHASQEFTRAASASGSPVALRMYADMLHDLHRDHGKEQVILDIGDWVLGVGKDLK